MSKQKTNKRLTLSLLSTAFVVIGTYNSIVVNSDEFMDHQQVRFVKRLDEVYGVVKPGREMANYGRWTKLASNPKRRVYMDAVSVAATPAVAKEDTVVEEVIENKAAIKEELALELNEVFNAKKYPQPPKAGEFSGSLTARDGEIESISVSLPGGDSFSVVSSAMTGNVFQYDGPDGEELSGMIYQMDKTSYMVTLTNGPLEGTRLKFNSSKEEEIGNNSAAVAENNYASEETPQAEEAPAFAPVVSDNGVTTEVGQFGNGEPAQQTEQVVADNAQPTEQPSLTFDEQLQQNAANEQTAQNAGQGFNFAEQPVSM